MSEDCTTYSSEKFWELNGRIDNLKVAIFEDEESIQVPIYMLHFNVFIISSSGNTRSITYLFWMNESHHKNLPSVPKRMLF
jgi:hypothetical protein